MRLLDTHSRVLKEFFEENVPEYAIFSHTWAEEEVSYQAFSQPESQYLAGYQKISCFCELAASDGYQYVWIDTCCIDKSSSAELSEAINSMYRWYKTAKICYAYLADVAMRNLSSSTPEIREAIGNSRWFTRGWTLQELLAPKEVIFYDANWQPIGNRSRLQDLITRATGIDKFGLMGPMRASVAAKMSWASARKTTRMEDTAYCLMGLFGVNMPLLYGEGSKAFLRLQHEIILSTDDESIFAWHDANLWGSGMFAASPAAFASCRDIKSVKFDDIRRSGTYRITHKGLSIKTFLLDLPGTDFIIQMPLNCARKDDQQTPLAVTLRRESADVNYFRVPSAGLVAARRNLELHCKTSKIYIRPPALVRSSEDISFGFSYAGSFASLEGVLINAGDFVVSFRSLPQDDAAFRQRYFGQGSLIREGTRTQVFCNRGPEGICYEKNNDEWFTILFLPEVFEPSTVRIFLVVGKSKSPNLRGIITHIVDEYHVKLSETPIFNHPNFRTEEIFPDSEWHADFIWKNSTLVVKRSPVVGGLVGDELLECFEKTRTADVLNVLDQQLLTCYCSRRIGQTSQSIDLPKLLLGAQDCN